MADRRVKVGLELEASGFEAGAKRAQRAAEGLGAATDKLGGQADKAAGGMSKVFDSVRANSADLQAAGTSLAAVGAGLTAASVGVGKAAMDWESAFAGVKKTVDDSAEGYAQLEGELRNLATTLPASHQEIAAVAEAERLQRSRAYCIDGIKLVALAKQKLAFFQRAAAFDDVVQRIHVFQIQ